MSRPNSVQHVHLPRGVARFIAMVRSLTSIVLTVIVMMGMLSMPFAAQSVANPMADASAAATDNMGDMPGMDVMELMSPDGDCCKQTESQAPDCADFCPLVMGCMAKCSPAFAIGASMHLKHFSKLAMAAPRDDGPSPSHRLPHLSSRRGPEIISIREQWTR